MTSPAIKISDLRVDYGDFVAVNDISLEVPFGEVFGIVGPNGAGKTSTFKVLATLMEPTYGEVSIAGVDILDDHEKAREIMGYMPDLAPVPSDLKLWEFLSFHADTHRLGNAQERRKRVDECLETVNLLDKSNSWCKELSRGQTQRLVLAKTLLHRPQVMILDEPASGLDPLSRREMRIALQQLASEGHCVLVSSHILTELTEMCSSLCVMNQGRLLASGTTDEVREQLGNSERGMTAVIAGETSKALSWINERPETNKVHESKRGIKFQFAGSEDDQVNFLHDLASAKIGLKGLSEEGSSFEEILVTIAEGNRES